MYEECLDPIIYFAPSLQVVQLSVFLPELKVKRGRRVEKTTTSKGLMHSNGHIKGNWATVGGGGWGGSTPLPSFGGITDCTWYEVLPQREELVTCLP